MTAITTRVSITAISKEFPQQFERAQLRRGPADQRCIELKSLKYYLIEFRNRGIFYEHVTNQILDDLVAAIEPRRMTVVGDFSVRGGMKTVVTATYCKS